MEKLLYEQTYDIKNLEEYNCSTVEELENKIISELRSQYDNEIILISEHDDFIIVKVEEKAFI